MRDVFGELQDVPGIERAAAANTRLLTGGELGTTILTIQSDERIVTDRAVSSHARRSRLLRDAGHAA